MTAAHRIPAPLAFATLAALGACSGPGGAPGQNEPVKVLAASPEARTYLPTEPIRIHFDRPVIGPDGIGVALADAPAAIEPAVAATARFVDRQTLVLVPEGGLEPSTRYRVQLRGELAARTGNFSFEFVSVPLEIEGVWGLDLEALPPAAAIPLHFNQPVDPAIVAKKCRFIDREGKSIAASTKAADPGSVIELTPGAPLALDTGYQLLCSGLTGAGGSEPMDGLYALALHTYPELAIVSVDGFGDEGEKVPADRTRFTISFSTPMDREAVRAGVRLEPAAEGADQGWLSYDGRTYTSAAALEPKTRYRLIVEGSVSDRFGQKLGASFARPFETGNASPEISMETGIYALETRESGYPIWTRNIGEMAISCAAVPAQSIVGLLTSGMDYDPWYNAQQTTIDWSKLGLRSRSKIVRPGAAENKWHLSRLDLGASCGGGHRGLYLAEIKSPDLKLDEDRRWAYRASRRVLANVTDLGVLLKAGTASGLVWVTSISTGKPVAGARVTVYSPRGARVFSGTTDRSGILKLPGTTRLLRQPGARDGAEHIDFESYRSQRMIAIVEKAGDRAVLDGNWANGIQTWNFGVDEDRKSGLTRIRGLLQTDRGIYRPGETVKLKGLVRELNGGDAPRVPRQRRVAVTIANARGAKVLDRQLDVSRFGGFDFSHSLTAEAPLGDYVVTATVGGQSFRERFQVEEFRKVTFEIDVEGVERHQRLGQKLAYRTTSKYLFGAPVAGAEVRWDVSRRPHLIRFPKRFPSYGFADYAAKGYYGWWWYDRDQYASFVENGEGRTDKSGALAFAVADSSGDLEEPYDYIAQVTVTDDTDQAVTKRVVVTAHPTELYLGLHAQEWVQAVGMPFAVNAVAVTPEGTQIARKATLSFIREEQSCTWKQVGYRSVPECETQHELAMRRAIEIPATGNATERIVPEKPGRYVVRIETTDGRGKKVTSSTTVWALGKGEAFWSGDESARMTVIASRPEYAPGETATLVPQTGLTKPTALVTLERNGVIEAFVREMDSASEGLSVPIAGGYAPNVFATVAMVSGRQGKGDRLRPRFQMGVVDLRIKSDHKRLAVVVETDKPKYEPGEKVRGTIRVRDAAGKPVSAEVAVSAADEGVLQLIGYQTPDPMKAFYASWGLGVDNSTNWNRISRLNAPAGADPDEGGDAGSPNSGIRSKFVNSAFWAPALVTNGRGEARFEFAAPDNLTAFRVMAVAAGQRDRFGSSDTRITVAKPLLAKPVLPRFLTEGDVAEVGVVIHNDTGSAGEVTVVASATGATLSAKQQKVRIAAGGSERVRFFATAQATEAASFQFTAAMDRYKDGLRLEIPVKRPLVMEEKILARGVIDGGARRQVSVPIRWAGAADDSASVLMVSVDRMGMSELEPALRDLVEYPYGCLEQTLSRFIPLTKVEDLAASLGMDQLRGPELATFLRAGAAKVVRHQHADGNYSLWPGGQTYPHLTVYASYGLLQAKRAGVAINQRAYDRGIAAIKQWVNQTLTTEMDLGTAAMAAYVLADSGTADAGLNARLFEKRAALPAFGRGFLLMAMHLGKADAGLRRRLAGELVSEAAGGVIAERGDQQAVMGSNVRTTAIVLSALLLEDPRNPAIEKMVEVLKDGQKPSGAWGTTQENLYGLVALADYARRHAAGTSQVAIRLDGKSVASQRLRGGAVLALSRSKAEAPAATLEITSRGRAVYTVRARQAMPLEASKPRSAGFSIERQLLDPETGKPVTRLQVGQVLIARVVVKSDVDRHWVALSNPLPAGLEPVNTKLATSRQDEPTEIEKQQNRWWMDRWDHTELGDDEVRAFRDHMPAGERVLTYRVRVTLPGRYTALPARVEEMYAPEVMGRSTARRIEVAR